MTNKSRRNFLSLSGLAVAGGMLLHPSFAKAQDNTMDTLTAIQTRRSIRSYTSRDVSPEEVTTLLKAAMAAPSAGNEQPWEFIVIRDKATLAEVPGINRFANMAKDAPVSILTCVNEELEKHPGYGILDVAAATQNLLLAAHAMGLGAVWTGIYPQQERVEGFRKLLGMPDTVIPLGLVVLGYPQSVPSPANRFNADRIHQEKWGA